MLHEPTLYQAVKYRDTPSDGEFRPGPPIEYTAMRGAFHPGVAFRAPRGSVHPSPPWCSGSGAGEASLQSLQRVRSRAVYPLVRDIPRKGGAFRPPGGSRTTFPALRYMSAHGPEHTALRGILPLC